MKLRNKKTGEIMDDAQYRNYSLHNGFGFRLGNKEYEYHTLAELNEEWEDYHEEPKDSTLDLMIFTLINFIENEPDEDKVDLEDCKQMLEKLKAIKILKDNGFRFIQWEFDMKTIADGKIWFDVGVNTQWDAEQLLKHRPEVKESLDLLFSGEDN